MGSFCVAGTQPHELTPAQRQALEALAVEARALLERRRYRVSAQKRRQLVDPGPAWIRRELDRARHGSN